MTSGTARRSQARPLRCLGPLHALELVYDATDRVLVEARQMRDPPVSRTRYALGIRLLGEDDQHAAGTR